MAKVADELVIPLSKYPRQLALPILIPRATLPPQSAIWSIIILISLNCIREGLEERKALFLSRSLGYAVSLSESKYRGRQHDPYSALLPPHLTTLLSSPSFPSAFDPLFSLHIFLPHQLIHLLRNETSGDLQNPLRLFIFFFQVQPFSGLCLYMISNVTFQLVMKQSHTISYKPNQKQQFQQQFYSVIVSATHI